MTIDVASRRSGEARLSKRIGKTGYQLLLGCSWGLLAAAIIFDVIGPWNLACWLAAVGLASLLPAVWWHRYLSVLPPSGEGINGRLSGEILARLRATTPQQPQAIWQAISDHWQVRFLMNHLLLIDDVIVAHLATDEAALPKALELAAQIADQQASRLIEPGFLAAALLASSKPMEQLLIRMKAQQADILALAAWLGRNLSEQRQKVNYGGIGRDWAFGFTPVLDRVGENLSLAIAKYGAHFGSLVDSEGVRNLEGSLANHATAIALIGPDGIGKTTSVYALAQRLIEGQSSQNLAYHQIVGVNATDLTSRARGPGELEHMMLTLANEAAHAGHIILFLDNAQLFFNEGPGSFDASQILLSVMEARTVPLILALTPGDFQRLKQHNTSMANLLTPVVLQELPEPGIMHVLEDTALRLEGRHHVLVAYEALHEAYRLSGRYEQDEAYPGKAIKLLEQAVPHATHSVVTSQSVQAALESSRGVRVSQAAPAEAEVLLHLEDRIHKRMINQTHAVKAVAGALRRARSGVTNQKRPIGSFLFLGPTGVGKTELAKAVATTYFSNESALIRLDMSEYQRPDDVQRLLSSGQAEAASLLLSVRQQPFSVVLLDEIEKAHSNVLNLLLQMLDEGQLTDVNGRSVSFKDCVIIATSNAGAQTIRERISRGEELSTFAEQFTDELINSGQFKPELLNRFDDLVLFRPLTEDELAQVVQLMLVEINQTLKPQNISLELTPAAVAKVVEEGNDPRLGARPLRRMLQRSVEDAVAQKILKGEARPGDHLRLDVADLTTNN